MNEFDYVVLAVGGVSLILGLWRGFVREVVALLSWVLAFWAVKQFGEYGVQTASRVFDDPLVQTTAGYALIFIGVLLMCAGLGALIRMMVSAAGLGLTDRVLGGVFGLARGVLLLMFGVLLCGLTSLPEKTWWQASKFAPPLETAVLATKPWLPDGIASKIRFPLR